MTQCIFSDNLVHQSLEQLEVYLSVILAFSLLFYESDELDVFVGERFRELVLRF